MPTAVLALYTTFPIACEGEDLPESLLPPRRVELQGEGNFLLEAEEIAESLSLELGCYVQVWNIE